MTRWGCVPRKVWLVFWECFGNTCPFPSAPFPEEPWGAAVLATWAGNMIVFGGSCSGWGIPLCCRALPCASMAKFIITQQESGGSSLGTSWWSTASLQCCSQGEFGFLCTFWSWCVLGRQLSHIFVLKIILTTLKSLWNCKFSFFLWYFSEFTCHRWADVAVDGEYRTWLIICYCDQYF